MKFISIPTNGSSWREPLIYKFTTDSIEPEDVYIEIIDTASNKTIGDMMLYGITTGEIDISSFVAYKCSLTPSSSLRPISIQRSSAAKIIRVSINGVTSAERLFFRSKINTNTIGTLSSHTPNQIIEQGDAWRLTMYAKSNISVKMSYSSNPTSQTTSSITTNGYPIELRFLTSNMQVGDIVTLEATYDNDQTQLFTYKIVERGATSKTLMWYNTNGGIEQYTFDHAVKISCSVEVNHDNSTNSQQLRVVKGKTKSRLCSGYESNDTIRHITQILLSPVIYTDKSQTPITVELDTHEVTFNDKGELHSITLNISEEWEGGEL